MYKCRLAFAALAIFFTSCLSFAAEPDWKYVEARLQKAGFQRSFISALKPLYEPGHFQQVLELNLLLYLKRADYHGTQVTGDATENVRAFMKKNRDALLKAEKDHGVPGNVIASLLWMESRHGENLGRFHVPSVYLHLVQADRPPIVKLLQKNAKKFRRKITAKIRADIKKRTKKKSAWALGELKSLQKMYRRDKSLVGNLRGSFSGAFGMAQFLPSSYMHWARAFNKAKTPDLLRPEDAIYSVAFYLKDNGWRRAKKTHKKALLRYNNSHDYANAILKLAGKTDGVLKRLPTSQTP